MIWLSYHQLLWKLVYMYRSTGSIIEIGWETAVQFAWFDWVVICQLSWKLVHKGTCMLWNFCQIFSEIDPETALQLKKTHSDKSCGNRWDLAAVSSKLFNWLENVPQLWLSISHQNPDESWPPIGPSSLSIKCLGIFWLVVGSKGSL